MHDQKSNLRFVIELCGTGSYKVVPEKTLEVSMRNLATLPSVRVNRSDASFISVEINGKNVSVFRNGTLILYDRERTEVIRDAGIAYEWISNRVSY